MRYIVRKNIVYVVGKLWQPGITAAQRLELRDYDVENARDDDGQITRESIHHWLDTHTGDFTGVIDFSASIEDGPDTVDIPWASEDGEYAYLDCMSESAE